MHAGHIFQRYCWKLAFWILLLILFFAFKNFRPKYTVYIIHRGLNCATNENDSASRWRTGFVKVFEYHSSKISIGYHTQWWKKTKKSRNRLLGFNHKNENKLLVRTGYRRYHLALFKFFEKLYFTYFWSLKNHWDNRWDNSDFRHSKIDMKPEVVLKPKIPWHTNQFFDIRWDKFQD